MVIWCGGGGGGVRRCGNTVGVIGSGQVGTLIQRTGKRSELIQIGHDVITYGHHKGER